MDLDSIKTFLDIARYGSFVSAAERLCVTQTAVSARIQKLENLLGCQLFVRNRGGCRLTVDGERFVVHATQLLQTWEAARRDLPMPVGCDNLLRIGGETSLCNPLMLEWIGALKDALPSHAIRSEIGSGPHLLRQLEDGELDAVLVYQPAYWPGHQVEQVLEEKLILVRAANPDPYVYIDWGEGFRQEHDSALPEKARAAVSFNLGPLALQYILGRGGSGYFRTRVVERYLACGLLQRVPKAPEFTYPTYLVYSRERDCASLQSAFETLRHVVRHSTDWSQRWNPVL
ncbi:LysR family transcriptional regulator [Pseudomonas sp. LRF_L74]|uniref:LysR family transcriptional regulator n=1 Tax=Pseudomonas sp. LRF_L74 TaxID=3369422 RepID=UPI003F60E138